MRRLQRLGHLPSQRPAKMRRQLGRSDEIAAAARAPRGHEAEFQRIVGVIAQARRVQRQRHETVKADPAAGLVNHLSHSGVQVGR